MLTQLRQLYLRYFSKPAADRLLYRSIHKHHARKIVELGVGTCQRAMRMVEVARQTAAPNEIHYVGFDLFEGRTEADGPGTSLKVAHQLLRSTGIRVQLVPGKPAESLIRLANSLGKVDLLILPAELDAPDTGRVWFFVPRMLHERSQVWIGGVPADGERTLRLKPREEIRRLSSAAFGRRAA